MTEKVRFGVVGLGAMGRNHARVLSQLPDAELVGAVDPAGDRHEHIGNGPLCRDLHSLRDQGIEAAVVAVPSEVHRAAALPLAERMPLVTVLE